MNLGLGIDAGGPTPMRSSLTLMGGRYWLRGKALTTKGDYTLGVCRAIDALDIQDPGRISMVALSTTLATNAIVENKGAEWASSSSGIPREIAGCFLRRPDGPWCAVSTVSGERSWSLSI